MKIRITNFGPIEKFEYDLAKDFIVVFGENNIGKSYSMQIVYLLLKVISQLNDSFVFRQLHMFDDDTNYYYEKGYNSKADHLAELVQNFSKSSNDLLDITDVVITNIFNQLSVFILDPFINSCENTFGNFSLAVNSNPIVEILFFDKILILDIKNHKISGDIKLKQVHLKKTKSKHRSRNYEQKYDIYLNKDNEITLSRLKMYIAGNVFELVENIRGFITAVYFLPASRSGIYSGMSAFSSIIAELSKNKAYLTRKIELPGISEPISDYFIALSNIKASEEKSFDFTSKIERDILKGRISFDNERSTLVYSPFDLPYRFDMTEVSSMVSEVSPIVAFFKYIISNRNKRYSNNREINQKVVIFIEEPEAHLHPKNQVRLINLFAGACKYDIKLVISSHSNYIFNKLNNMVLSKELDYQTYEPIILDHFNSGSTSRYLKIDDLGVDDENFIDVSLDLINERDNIISNMLNTKDAD